MFPISLVSPGIPSIKIIDVGAMYLRPVTDPYHNLTAALSCKVMGFEPVV